MSCMEEKVVVHCPLPADCAEDEEKGVDQVSGPVVHTVGLPLRY